VAKIDVQKGYAISGGPGRGQRKEECLGGREEGTQERRIAIIWGENKGGKGGKQGVNTLKGDKIKETRGNHCFPGEGKKGTLEKKKETRLKEEEGYGNFRVKPLRGGAKI